MPLDELVDFAALGISVSDTETTGLNRERNGLTEIASIRGFMEEGKPRLKLFHSFILPLRPAYQDYLRQCEEAKRNGTPPPPYDRRLYEYAIEPAALAVTGTEIERKRKDGPITGLKINGKHVDARPFYEVMNDFLAFTRHGDQDVYYNAPFDRPFLGALIGDVLTHRLAGTDIHMQPAFQQDERLPKNVRATFREYAHTSYHALKPSQQLHILAGVRGLVDVPSSYTNPALYQCLYYGFLAKNGFGPSNTLDDATRALVDAGHGKRGDHSGVEDVIMAARVGLRLANPGIHEMRGLYETILRRVDPHGQALALAPRIRRPRKERVEGDIALQFSAAPESLGEDAVRFWEFLAAFKEAPRINSRLPRHVLRFDEAQHLAVINAERKQPLSLNFLKKCVFFKQMLDSPVLYTMRPYDSTGNRIDVVLRCIDPASGERQVVRDVHYGSLRANVAFLEAHPTQAAGYLSLISRLRKVNRAVGMVLLRERGDSSVDIIVKGHLRAFGECLMHIPPGIDPQQALPALERELETQIKLGIIPEVGHFGEDTDTLSEDDPDELSTQPRKDRHEDAHSSAYTSSHLEDGGQRMSLTLSTAAFACIARRLGESEDSLLSGGVLPTANGAVLVSRQEDKILLRGPTGAFYDFIEMKPGTLSEKPSNLIRDASWLLYRLERIPGTYGLRLEGDMAILDQRDGVDVEALGLLYHVGIPFKAYGTSIKVDAQQLMKNAFHWSLTLSRTQKERKEQIDAAMEGRNPPARGYKEPQRFLQSAQHALLSGKAGAFEMNEKRDCWLLDTAQASGEQPIHHPLLKSAQGIELVYGTKGLIPESSDIKGVHTFRPLFLRDGSMTVHASPLLLALASYRLAQMHIDTSLFPTPSQDSWHVPADTRVKTIQALTEASRFLYWLGKQTGSERLCIESMELHTSGRVTFHLPHLRFLGDTLVYTEALRAYTHLSDVSSDKHIRHLQHHLPDPRKVDARQGDVMQLARSVFEHIDTIDALHHSLNQYLRLFGAAEHAGDPEALIFADALRDDLATLGVLLHELAATPHKHAPMPEVWQAVQTAQEKLAAAVFGNEHLKEDLAVARKALVGGVDADGGVRAETGHGLGTVLLDAALEAARYDPVHFSRDTMVPYRQQVERLLGDSQGRPYPYYARHAAMRYLLELRDASDPVSLQDKVAHYLLAEAFPSYSSAQCEALLALYRHGRTPGTEDQLRLEFLARRSRNAPTEADTLLQQYDLLTHPKTAQLSFDEWLRHHPQPSLEEDVRKAYQRRGKLYIQMATLLNPNRDDTPAFQADYLARGERCLSRAEWTDERIKNFRVRASGQYFSDARKAHIRKEVEFSPDMAHASRRDLLLTIDHEGHEERFKALRLENAYTGYQKNCERLTEDIADPYYLHKQRMRLLGHVEKSLDETHDLLMSKYHHVRDLQGLLALLQQDHAIAGHLDNPAARIGEIGKAVRPIPELTGLHDDTLTQIQDYIAQLRSTLHTHFSGQLNTQKIEHSKDADDTLSCELTDLQHAFTEWRKEKPRTIPAALPEHLYSWLDRASQRLFRVAGVEAVMLDKTTRQVECRVRLPHDKMKRAQYWAELRLAAVGLGLRLPAMPENGGEIHTLQLPLLRRVQRNETAFDAPARPHDIRQAIGAFAVKEGLPAEDEKSFVSRVMKQPDPRSLPKALARAKRHGSNTDEISLMLTVPRQR